jgi:hypothetical protein
MPLFLLFLVFMLNPPLCLLLVPKKQRLIAKSGEPEAMNKPKQMVTRKKRINRTGCFAAWFLLVTILAGLCLVSDVNAANSFHGILTQSGTWTRANSPYTLDGPLAIDKGVTITVEPGVTINLNGFYIQVNGTLIAQGTDNDKIYFNNGEVRYTSVAGSGSIFENTVTDNLETSATVRISKNTFSILDAGGSSTVSDNTIKELHAGGSAVVTNNQITDSCYVGGSSQVKSNNINTRLIFVSGANAVVSDNRISDGVHCDIGGNHVTISNNEIYCKGNYPLILVAGAIQPTY